MLNLGTGCTVILKWTGCLVVNLAQKPAIHSKSFTMQSAGEDNIGDNAAFGRVNASSASAID